MNAAQREKVRELTQAAVLADNLAQDWWQEAPQWKRHEEPDEGLALDAKALDAKDALVAYLLEVFEEDRDGPVEGFEQWLVFRGWA